LKKKQLLLRPLLLPKPRHLLHQLLNK